MYGAGLYAFAEQNARAVSPKSKEGGMAQGDHSAVANQQVKAGRGDGEDNDAAGHAEVEIDPRSLQYPGQCQNDKNPCDRADSCRAHQLRTGNRPCGRNTSITAISR